MSPRPQRQPGLVPLGEPMRRRIARLRHLDPRSGATTLDIAKVAEVESALDCHFEPDVLAVLASGVPDLAVDAGIDLGRVLERTRTARGLGCPDDVVVIGGHATLSEFYCVKAQRPADEPLYLIEFTARDKTLSGRPIVEWVEVRLEVRREALLTGTNEERARASKPPSVAEIARFQPSLVVAPPAPAQTTRRVRHAKFGVGEALSEVGSGDAKKINVRFESGTKLLLASVLESVE